jgi:hypothetical protein
MTLEVLRVKVRLLAVGARELAILILLGDDSGLGAAGSDGGRLWPARRAREDAPPALGSDNVRGLLLIRQGRGLHRNVGRGYAGLGSERAVRRHRPQDGSGCPVGGRGRCDWLRVD